MAKKPAPKKSAAPATPPAAVLSGAVALEGTGPKARRVVTERGLGAIELLAANGRSTASIAKALGIGRRTLDEVCERQPEVVDAIERGRGALTDELHDILMDQARRGNTTSAIFLAKWRLNARDSGPVQDNNTPRVAIQINLPSPKSVEDYMRTIVASTSEVA